jgi:drug/metabolite transporter (DMT)-like permease
MKKYVRRMTASTTNTHQSIHGALILANSIFGLGSIVGALGISQDTNPLAFTFVREICSGGSLWGLSQVWSGGPVAVLPEIADFPAFWRLGFLLFLNQAGYIVGVLLAGPVTGSIWQPSAPIITVAISILGGLEAWNARRILGVLIAFAGCAGMVVLSDRDEDETHGGAAAFWIGNAMFLLNCTATAFYILCSKPVLVNYPALTVTAWSYLLASVFMLVSALISANIEAVDSMICPARTPATQNRFPIAIPYATLPALVYYIIFQSVAAWGLILWANQFATGTLIVGYTVTQPISAIFFTTVFLVTHWVASCTAEGAPTPCLNEPGLGTLCGIAGVACGLALVVQTEPQDAAIEGATEDVAIEDEERQAIFKPSLSVDSLQDYGAIPLG